MNFGFFNGENSFLAKNGIDIPWTFYSTQNWFPGDVTRYHVMLKNVIFLTFHLRNSLFRKTYILSIYLIDLEVINQKAVYQTPHPITWWSDLYRYTYCISYTQYICTVHVQYIIKSKYDHGISRWLLGNKLRFFLIQRLGRAKNANSIYQIFFLV